MNSYVVFPRFSVHAALSQSWLSPKQAFALAGSSLPLPPSSVLPPPPSSSEGSGHAETDSAARQRHSMTQHTKVICYDNGYDNGYDISCRDAIHCLEPKLLWGTKCAKQTGGWWFGWPAKSANTCGIHMDWPPLNIFDLEISTWHLQSWFLQMHFCVSALEWVLLQLSARCLRGNKNCYAAGTFVELFNCLLDQFADWKKTSPRQLVSWQSIPSSDSEAAYSKRGGRDRCFAAQRVTRSEHRYNVDASW